MSGQSGSSHANNAWFEQFPFGIQIKETGLSLNSQRSTKDCFLPPRVFPNRAIVGGLQSEVKDVCSLMALGGNPAGQRRRELHINDEVHAGCKTAWSAWRAA